MDDSKTARVLRYMFTENTGRALCDSGDAYGRNYERNRGADLDARPEATLTVSGPYDDGRWYIEAEVDAYHFLLNRLEYSASLTRQLRKFARSDPEAYWLEIMETFPEHLAEKGHDVAGLYGQDKPLTVNTYNGEDMLSQVLQYTYMTVDGDPYVILQVHGGCDVRGGYTEPRVFSLGSYEETSIFDNARATIACQPAEREVPGQMTLDGQPAPRPEQHYWDTDDTCNWYYEGTAGAGAGRHLEDYELTRDPARKGDGIVYLDDDGTVYCPLCGGPLSLYAPLP